MTLALRITFLSYSTLFPCMTWRFTLKPQNIRNKPRGPGVAPQVTRPPRRPTFPNLNDASNISLFIGLSQMPI